VSATERRKHRPDGTILNRALETAASNLRIEKVLLQFGLDPTHLTVDAIMDRLIDMGLANINFANTLALVGAILYVATQLMRTIVPLRVVGILSILFFIAYGAMAGAVATFFLSLSAFSADQCYPPPPDAVLDQKSSDFGAGQFINGMA
jgi:hypothetical protein